MKPGSLVVCIDNSEYKSNKCITPELEPVIYTVRHFNICSCGCGRGGIKLEEIVNPPPQVQIGPITISGPELMYLAEDFREVVPADKINLENLLKNVEA